MCVTIYLLLITVNLLLCEVSAFTNTTIDDKIPDTFLNLTTNNELWNSLIKDCKEPTMSCIENTMFGYLKDTLEYSKDYQISSIVKLKKNTNEYHESYPNENNDDDDDEIEEPRSSIEEMSRTLYDKSVKFLMTHDMELQLPEMIFNSAVLKISPRSLEDNGALVKLEVLPGQVAEGRIFKKLKNLKNKLVYALLAILLVIKLLAMKLMFFMPMMVGAVTAKKLLIKVLLFLFPALHHLFKLCPYVPHGTKYHHHKHQIKHIHHVGPPRPHHHHHHHPHDDGIEIIAPHAEGPPFLHSDKPSLHHFSDIEFPSEESHNSYESKLEYYPKGPIHHNQYLHFDRKDDVKDDNELKTWGQGQDKKKSTFGRPLTPTEIEAMILKAEKEALLKQRLQQERLRIQQENARLQEELRRALKLQERLRQQASVVVKTRLSPPPLSQPPPPPSQVLQQPPPITERHKIIDITTTTTTTSTTENVLQYTKKLVDFQPTKQPTTAFEQALHQAASITYDPFYSPILDKIDKILTGLGFNEEPCRERLICSMYKNPMKFSPHSNLLSAELSRDPNELQKPTTTNAAVVRFYRYVQAARDGQDKRDCIRLYANCAINTDK